MKKLLFTGLTLWFIAAGAVGDCRAGNGFTGISPKLHALIIGISDYHYLDDLRYAHRDALLFRDYLSNTVLSDGDSANITVLLNEEAISSRIYAALENLAEEVESGDRVFIFFSGHGDSEDATLFRSGYLLTHDTPEERYYTNALNIDLLNDFIHTLSIRNEAEVIFISDACRSGAVRRTDERSVAKMMSALSGNLADETRMLSCQPDELSLEGPQWGGGAGLFTWYLINGLYGMADDADAPDGKITLNELDLYLNKMVVRDADPVQQHPGIYGKMGKVIARVDPVMLAQWKEGSERQLDNPCRDADCKTYEQRYLAALTEEEVGAYKAFDRAVSEGRLRGTDGRSAYSLYTSLAAMCEEEALMGLLKRRLIVALEADGQLYMHELEDESKRWDVKDIRYRKWAGDLALAADLAGPGHYRYRSMQAKHHFFDAAANYYSAAGHPNTINFQKYLKDALIAIDQAIDLEKEIIYFQLMKGYILLKQGRPTSALKVFSGILKERPEYAYTYYAIAQSWMALDDMEQAIANCDLAIALDPEYTNAYLLKIRALRALKRYSETADIYEKMMGIESVLTGY